MTIIKKLWNMMRGIDHAFGEALVVTAGSYHTIEKFLDDNPDIGCPWCGMVGHHAVNCRLIEEVREEGF
jgi:hypothetical protein